jgi:hypothetical protein
MGDSFALASVLGLDEDDCELWLVVEHPLQSILDVLLTLSLEDSL